MPIHQTGVPVPPNPYIEVTAVVGELCRSFDGPPPTYAQVKTAIYSGRAPGMKLPSGRLAILRSDLPKVAAVFGMPPKIKSGARKTAQHVAV